MKVFGLFLLVSCAATSIVVKQNELVPYRDSAKISKVPAGSASLQIESIRDLRASQDMGFAYTGVKYQKTPVLLETSIEDLVLNYLSEQLELRNIEVLSEDSTKLEVSIITFQVYEFIEKFKPERAKCEVQLEFKIQDGAKTWDGNYSVEYTSAGDLTDGTKRLAPTLASCMNNLTEKLMKDSSFIEFLNKG